MMLEGSSNDFPENDFLLIERNRVAQAAHELLSRVPKRGHPTMGIELEFFLRDQDSKGLCGLDQSQSFLLELSRIPKWEIFLKNRLSDKVVRVSRNRSDGRFHSVKYEHPPHMLEVALAYESDLTKVHQSLSECLLDLFTAARGAGVEIDFSGCVEPPAICWQTVGLIEGRFEQLSSSRRKIFENLRQVALGHSNDPLIDFTAFTAATQYHIGGLQWWQQDHGFIDRLYRIEYFISGQSFHGSRTDFERRWSSYRYVFGDMKLLGFPMLPVGSFEGWIDGLLNSPWIEEGVRTFGDKSRGLCDADLLKILPTVRDLQIIKPKWIGTLEYRSDPATADVRMILRNAALRLGAYLAALDSSFPMTLLEPTFTELSRSWWSGAHINPPRSETERVEELCFQALRSRGLGEERFL